MTVPVLVGFVCVGVGVVVLAALVAVGAREWRRGPAEGADAYPASIAYAVGLWCLPTGIGFVSAGTVGGVVLGAAAAVALVAVVVPRSGMRFVDGTVRFGTAEVRLDDVASVVRSPAASFGRAYGTWGVADGDGRWLAAFRPHAARHGAAAVHELIARAGLEPQSDGRTWSRPGSCPPQDPFPAMAR